MRKRIDVAISACTLLLTSCAPVQDQADDSPHTSQPTTTTASSEPSGEVATSAATTAPDDSQSAFYFASGTLPIGDFDPLEVHPNVFNPCEEISAEEFAQVGFEVIGEPVSRYEGTVIGCSLGPFDLNDRDAISIAGSLVLTSELEKSAQRFWVHEPDSGPRIAVHQLPGDAPDTCRSAVSTERGQIIISASTMGSSSSEKSRICDRSIQIIHQLHLL